MPQLILEHSTNIIEKDDIFTVLKSMNTYLSATLPTDMLACKSRSMEYDTFCVGDGDESNAFVHINLKVMPGRPQEKLTDIGNHLLNLLKEFFSESGKEFHLQITVEISELEKTYFKIAT